MVTVTLVPFPGVLSTTIEPSCDSVMERQMDRPRPFPPVRRLRAESTR